MCKGWCNVMLHDPVMIQITHAANMKSCYLTDGWNMNLHSNHWNLGLYCSSSFAYDKQRVLTSCECVLMCISSLRVLHHMVNIWNSVSHECTQEFMCSVDCACAIISGCFLAPNQQNATGISVTLPWQQTNARAEGSSRIRAQQSSQQGEEERSTWLGRHLCSWSPSSSTLFISHFRLLWGATKWNQLQRLLYHVGKLFLHICVSYCTWTKCLSAQWHKCRCNDTLNMHAERATHQHPASCRVLRWMSTW